MKRILLATFIVLLFACDTDKPTSDASIDRPIDTWVFRSVLDNYPRMITVALNKNLYISYFTQKAQLYKAWKGIVNFEGAVYDGAHGPQPTSVGDAYLINDANSKQWVFKSGGAEVDYKVEYRGHSIENGVFTIKHDLISDSGKKVSIAETADAVKETNGDLNFQRSFSISGLDDGDELIWNGHIIEVDKSLVKSNYELEIGESPEKIEVKKKEFYKYDVKASIKNGKALEINFPATMTFYPDPNIEDGFEGDAASLPLGGVLIGKHDCKTCHNRIKKTVGPSYVSIAKKYEHTDENRLMLVNKIKNGGSGIWGEQVMTPHPEISNADLSEMVKYIFDLADFEGEASSKSSSDAGLVNAVEIDENDLIPGSVTRVYKIESGIPLLPTDLESRTPIQGGIIPNFDNLSGSDFKDLEDDFAILSTGYLYIEREGIYDFRIWSDDGSKMYLHDKLIISNDGLHGTEMRQGRMLLQKGYHPFKIEFFQGSGGKFLSWNYKPETSEFWQVIPQDIISHDKNDQKGIDKMSLPMSVVTKIPGDRNPVTAMHPSFTLSQARPDSFEKKIGGMDFLSDGRLLVSTWDSDGAVYLLEGVGKGDPENITYKKVAFGLAEPLGLKVVGDRIFVMQKQEMTELIDHNGDDIIDEYRTLCDDWGVSSNFHEFGFGLAEKDGFLYATLATGIMPGGAGMVGQHPDRGSCIKVSIEDGSIEFVANGLRTPNGIGIGHGDDIYIADNQGDWLPSSKILHVSDGAWFGSRAVDFDGTANKIEKKPVVWLPQDEIGNSPSTPLALNVGPYKNQMIHGEVTHGGVKRVYVEEVEGQKQGAVFRFIQGLEAGVNRIAWGPDGALYAGGIGNPGNWQHTGQLWYGLQRMEYNNESTFEMLSVSARTDGVEITFTEPLKPGEGWSFNDYEVKQWYYLPTADYGGPKLDDKILNIKSVNVSEDRRSVFLELDGMKEDHMIYVRLKNHFVSEQEHSLWTTEAWYTMNKIPKNKPGFKSGLLTPIRDNQLTEIEKEQGWELLFDGKNIDKFHTFKTGGVDSKWEISNGAIHFNPKNEGKGGDFG